MNSSRVNVKLSSKTSTSKVIVKIAFFWLIAHTAIGQEVLGLKYTSKFSNEGMNYIKVSQIFASNSLLNLVKFTESIYAHPPSLQSLSNRSIYLPVYKPRHYGAFCKIENLIESASKVPVRFRLGSLDYVNYLEQKYVVSDRSMSRKKKKD